MVRHELIGLNCKIVNAKNPSLKGLKGKIIDETKNTFTIQKNNIIKKIIKNQVTMKLNIKPRNKIVEGKDIVGRPEERIKK